MVIIGCLVRRYQCFFIILSNVIRSSLHSTRNDFRLFWPSCISKREFNSSFRAASWVNLICLPRGPMGLDLIKVCERMSCKETKLILYTYRCPPQLHNFWPIDLKDPENDCNKNVLINLENVVVTLGVVSYLALQLKYLSNFRWTMWKGRRILFNMGYLYRKKLRKIWSLQLIISLIIT